MVEESKAIQNLEWKIHAEDTFDRECPIQVELTGKGLEKGLAELWSRHLFETIRPGGQIGFIRFSLFLHQISKSIQISGNVNGLTRIREWVFQGAKPGHGRYSQHADRLLLNKIAEAHGRLFMAGKTSEPIVSIALRSKNRQEFLDHLMS